MRHQIKQPPMLKICNQCTAALDDENKQSLFDEFCAAKDHSYTESNGFTVDVAALLRNMIDNDLDTNERLSKLESIKLHPDIEDMPSDDNLLADGVSFIKDAIDHYRKSGKSNRKDFELAMSLEYILETKIGVK